MERNIRARRGPNGRCEDEPWTGPCYHGGNHKPEARPIAKGSGGEDGGGKGLGERRFQMDQTMLIWMLLAFICGLILGMVLSRPTFIR